MIYDYVLHLHFLFIQHSWSCYTNKIIIYFNHSFHHYYYWHFYCCYHYWTLWLSGWISGGKGPPPPVPARPRYFQPILPPNVSPVHHSADLTYTSDRHHHPQAQDYSHHRHHHTGQAYTSSQHHDRNSSSDSALESPELPGSARGAAVAAGDGDDDSIEDNDGG